jgi:hypothetical protein
MAVVTEKIPSVQSLWLADTRADLIAALPAGASDKDVKKHLSAAWNTTTADVRKPYADQRRALINKNKPPKSSLPAGWKVEEIDGRRAWTHAESGALFWRKPLNRQRVLAGVARRGAGPGPYAQFVKQNYKALGSLAACAAAWKESKPPAVVA